MPDAGVAAAGGAGVAAASGGAAGGACLAPQGASSLGADDGAGCCMQPVALAAFTCVSDAVPGFFEVAHALALPDEEVEAMEALLERLSAAEEGGTAAPELLKRFSVAHAFLRSWARRGRADKARESLTKLLQLAA